MARFPEWVDSWEDQYKEHKDNEVLKADIKVILRTPSGEIHIIHSEYLAKHMDSIKDLQLTKNATVQYIGG